MTTNGMNRKPLALACSAPLILAPSIASAAAEGADELTSIALELDANAQRGAVLYSKECAGCHGREAGGAGQHDIPALASQRRAYIIRQLAQFIERDRIATQMHLAAGHRFDVDEDLARFLRSMKADEMQGLADYLSRLQGPVRDRARLKNDGTVSD
jgi:cytochrome c553